MSTTLIARVWVAPYHETSRVDDAVRNTVNTATFRGAAWRYPDDGTVKDAAVGGLYSFEQGLASPLAGLYDSAGKTAAEIRRAIRKLVGTGPQVTVEVLDADRADWRSGLKRASVGT